MSSCFDTTEAVSSTMYGDGVFGLLKKINHVKCLNLGARTVEVSVMLI